MHVFDFASGEDPEIPSDHEFMIKYKQLREGEWTTAESKLAAKGMVSPALVLSTVASFSRGGSAAANGLMSFYAQALRPDSIKEFNRLTSDESVRLDMKSLAEICDWIMEQYGERPTVSA